MGSVTLREGFNVHGPLRENELYFLALSIGSCLAEVHQEGKTLGCLSSDAIFVSDDGVIKIGNSGKDVRGTTLTEYIAPEVLTGSRPKPSSDIYQLGLLMCEAATGEEPFNTLPANDRARAVLTERPYKTVKGISPSMFKLSQTCFMKDPSARPVDGSEFLVALENSAVSDSIESDAVEDLKAWLGRTVSSAGSLKESDVEGSPALLKEENNGTVAGVDGKRILKSILIIVLIIGLLSAVSMGSFFTRSVSPVPLVGKLKVRFSDHKASIGWVSPEEIKEIQWKLSCKQKIIATGESRASSFSTYSVELTDLKPKERYILILHEGGKEAGKIAFTCPGEVE